MRDFVERYTFVKYTEFKNGVFRIFYEKDNKIRHKTLPFLTTKLRLMRTIENIKKDIDYYTTKKEIDIKVRDEIRKDSTPLIFKIGE